MTAEERVKRLEIVCQGVLLEPAFEPGYPVPGVTHCNEALHRICLLAFEYGGFKGLTANRIADKVEKDVEWTEIGPNEAHLSAEGGRLAIASWRNPDPKRSGHCAVVHPGAMTFSGKWAAFVPLVCNVGSKNAVMGANWAFHKRPRYFLWDPPEGVWT